MSNTTDVKKEPTVCRTCLNVITGFSFRLHENSGLGKGLKFTHILRYIVPELYLGLSQGPEICQNCKQSLKIAYTFRKKCLETETLIGNYLKNVRCTAQVIDLSAVINYLRAYKTSNLQNILSEWNDDSCEDSPLAEMPPLALLDGTDTTPSTETGASTLDPPILTPEVIMTPIPDIRNAINNPLLSIVQKAAMQTLVPIVDPALLVPQVILGAISEATTSTSKSVPLVQKVAIPRDPKQFSDATSSASNSVVPISKSVIPREHFLVYDENKPVRDQKETSNPVVKQKEANKENNIAPVQSATVQTQQTPVLIPKVEPISSGVREKSVELLKVCPETGLFRSKAGRYFNAKGQMLSQADVKALQTKTEQRVQSILQKADAEMKGVETKGAEVKGIRVRSVESLKEKPKTHEQQMESEKIGKETSAQIHQTTDAENRLVKIKEERKENSLNVCEETGLLKDQDGHYFDFYGNPLEKEQVEAERKKARIRGETLFKISNICTVTDEDFSQLNKNKLTTSQIPADFEENIDAHQIPKDNTNAQPIKISSNKGKANDAHQTSLPIFKEIDKFVEMVSLDNLQRRSILKSTLLNSQPANVLNFMADKNLRIPQQLSPTLRQDPQIIHFNISGSATDAVISPVKIKEEPVDPAELDKLLDDTSGGNNDAERTDSEETLSAPDINESELGSWQTLINSLDSCENSQYVDVPDFVQINNFTFEDLERLRVQSDTKNPDDPGSNWFDNLLQKKLKFIPDVEAPPPRPYLPDTFTYRGKRLIKFKNGYKFEDPLPSHVSPLPHSGSEIPTEEPPPEPETSDPVLIDVGSEKKQTSTKSGSLIFQPIKERKRIGQAAKGRRRRLKIVPVGEPVVVKTEIPRLRSPTPDREICVLFTNYTEDGIYINDHDYLTSPYVRNNLLYDENDGKSYCMCYICGQHHSTDQHVSHMITHESRCESCSLNLGTPYMLNMHMKIHAKPCKYCTDVIPYPDIESHAKKHEAEEQDQEEEVEPKRRKKNKYDEDEEFHVPGVIPIRRGTRGHLKDDDRRRSTRNRTRTDESPDDVTEAPPRRKIPRLGSVSAKNTRLSSGVSPETSRTHKRTRRTRGDNPVNDSPNVVDNVLTTPTVVDGIFNEPMIIDNIVTEPPVFHTTPILVDNTLITPIVIDSIPSTSIIVDDKQITPTVVNNMPSIAAPTVNNQPTIVEDTAIVIEDSSTDAAESLDFDAIKEHVKLTCNLTNPYVLLKKMAVIETFWVKKMNNVVLPDTDTVKDDISDVQEISTNDTVPPTSDNDVVSIVPEDIRTESINDPQVDTFNTTKVEGLFAYTPRKSGRIRRIVNEKPIEIDDSVAENSGILHKHISVDPLLDVKKVATYVPYVPKKRGRKPKSFYNNDSRIESQESPVIIVPDDTIKTTSDADVDVVNLDPVTENLTGTTSTLHILKKKARRSKNVEIESHESTVIIVSDDSPTTTTDDVISIDPPTSIAVDIPKVESLTLHAPRKRGRKSRIESNESAVIVVPDDIAKTTTDEVINVEPSTEIAVGISKVDPLVIHLPKKRGQKPKILEVSHSKIEGESTISVASDDITQTTTDKVINIDPPNEVLTDTPKVDDSFQNISKKRGKKPNIAEPAVGNLTEDTAKTTTDSVTFTDRTTEVPVHIDNSTKDVPKKRKRKPKIIDISNSKVEANIPVVSILPETINETTAASVKVTDTTTEVPVHIDNSTKKRLRKPKVIDISNSEIEPDMPVLSILPETTIKATTDSVTGTNTTTEIPMEITKVDNSSQDVPKKRGRKPKIVDGSNSEIEPHRPAAMPEDITKTATDIVTITDRTNDMDTPRTDILTVHTPKKRGRKRKNDQDTPTDELVSENVSIIEPHESSSVTTLDSKNDILSTDLATDSAVGTPVVDPVVQSSSKKKEKRKTKDEEEIKGNVVKSRMLRSTSKKIEEDSNNAEAATTEDTIIKTNEKLQIEAHTIDSTVTTDSLHPVIHTTESIQSDHTTESIDFSNQTTDSKQPESHADGSVQVAENAQTEVDTTGKQNENNDSQKMKDNNENEAVKVTR